MKPSTETAREEIMRHQAVTELHAARTAIHRVLHTGSPFSVFWRQLRQREEQRAELSAVPNVLVPRILFSVFRGFGASILCFTGAREYQIAPNLTRRMGACAGRRVWSRVDAEERRACRGANGGPRRKRLLVSRGDGQSAAPQLVDANAAAFHPQEGAVLVARFDPEINPDLENAREASSENPVVIG
jgi:hypothetical protein